LKIGFEISILIHMAVQLAVRDDQDILNYCAKYISRDTSDLQEFRARICEPWRFPIIDGYSDGQDFIASYQFNEVTFVYATPRDAVPEEIGVVGTFANLYEPVPLRRLKFQDVEMPYFAVTAVVPKGQVHTYKFVLDGEALLDPINPQQVTLENGKVWSRFFTQNCTQPISLERWEYAILQRLTDHILPFRTEEGQRALEQGLVTKTFLLDESVGAVNFIDKLIAREENHYLDDYKICLELIDRVLRQRNPFVDPEFMPKQMYVDLYNEMATNNVPGWNYGRYGSPRFFLQLLRRHTFTGAFAHPKYGGNTQCAGWAYLEEKFRDASGKTLFDWRRAIEKPLGNDPDYHG
jgi:hypothetical protein